MAHTCTQEQRFSKIEQEILGQSKDLQNLIKRLDKLTNGIWALILTLTPTVAALFGFLLWQVISKR